MYMCVCVCRHIATYTLGELVWFSCFKNEFIGKHLLLAHRIGNYVGNGKALKSCKARVKDY